MVLTLMIPVRHIFKLHDLITIKHIDNMAKITLLTGTIVGYAYAMEFFTAALQRQPERGLGLPVQPPCRPPASNLFDSAPYWWAYWLMITCNVLCPSFLV
jgi:hypothetical protein